MRRGPDPEPDTSTCQRTIYDREAARGTARPHRRRHAGAIEQPFSVSSLTPRVRLASFCPIRDHNTHLCTVWLGYVDGLFGPWWWSRQLLYLCAANARKRSTSSHLRTTPATWCRRCLVCRHRRRRRRPCASQRRVGPDEATGRSAVCPLGTSRLHEPVGNATVQARGGLSFCRYWCKQRSVLVCHDSPVLPSVWLIERAHSSNYGQRPSPPRVSPSTWQAL